MVLKFPVSEWFQSSGNAAAEFQENLRDEIATFACSLWSQFPNFIVNGKDPTSSFARGFMNQACSPIQSFVPFPAPGFTGGQCPGVVYTVTMDFELRTDQGACPILNDGTVSVNVTGPVQGVEMRLRTPNVNVISCFAAGPYPIDSVDWVLVGANEVALANNVRDGRGVPTVPLSRYTITGVARADGQPDTCGDPVPEYPSPPPTAQDLTTIINIVNLDGVANNYTLTYNQINNNFNFPVGFKLDGVNVVLDIEGITIYGDPFSTSPNTPNESPPPGTDGGRDGEGNDYVVVFTEQVYPVTSEYSQPQTIEKDIEYIICNEGVIETIIDTITTVLPLDPVLEIILLLLGEVIREICGIQDQQVDVGLPEYYPVLPGTERPAIVYLYKEIINGVKQRSTYSSTVNNPSSAAVAGIDTIVVPDKTIGQYVCSATMTDGTRIRASGDSEMVADTNFNFLLAQVEPTLIPSNLNDRKVITFYPLLQVVTVVCTQIEYYPNGKAAGVSPAIRRIIST